MPSVWLCPEYEIEYSNLVRTSYVSEIAVVFQLGRIVRVDR